MNEFPYRRRFGQDNARVHFGRVGLAARLADAGDFRDPSAGREGAALVKVGVAAEKLVPGLLEEAGEDDAYVAAVTGDEDAHLSLSQVAHGRLPEVHISSSFVLSRSVSMQAQNPSWG